MIITKVEALTITNNARYLKNHKDEAHLKLTLKGLDDNIRAAAQHGQYHSIWTTGGASFREEIESILKVNGFDMTFEEGSYRINWDPPNVT